MADDASTGGKRLQVDLSGQVAVVTGASQGLGQAISEALAACTPRSTAPSTKVFR